jgi:hypothetical protein
LFNEETNNSNLPMSIQQCYETFFKNNLTSELMSNDNSRGTNVAHVALSDYRIYSSLIKHGYILRRSKCPLTLMQEINIKSSIDEIFDLYKRPKIEKTIIDSKKDHSNLTMNAVYSKLNKLIPNITLKELKQRLSKNIAPNQRSSSKRFNLLYDIYLPNKNFRKSRPGVPTCKLITPTKEGQRKSLIPKLSDLILNNDESSSSSTKQIYSFVCNDGDILFYSFTFNNSIPCVYGDFDNFQK